MEKTKKDYLAEKAEGKKLFKQAMILLVFIVVVFFSIVFRLAFKY
jgi:hypothetical protein